MISKRQLKKFEKNLDILRSITRAFEHTATKRMEVNKQEIEKLAKHIVEVKQTYVNAKISQVKKRDLVDVALRLPTRRIRRQKIVILISSEPQYYGNLLGYMAKQFIAELEAGSADAIIVGKPGREEVDKLSRRKLTYTFFDFNDAMPNWRVVQKIGELVLNYNQIQVFFCKFKSILTQDVKKEDVAGEIANVSGGFGKKYLIKPEPQEALSYLEQQIITAGILSKLYENGLSKSAIRVKILEIGEIAQRFSEVVEAFEKFRRKMIRDINNHKLSELYGSSEVWRSESIFTVYR